jgi:hypothetical protein
MRRFYLHVVKKSEIIEDDDGVELPEFDVALKEATMALREMVAADIKSGNDNELPDAIIVADETKHLYTLHATAVIPRRLRG